MNFDLRSPAERAYQEITQDGERHQVNWILRDGAVVPVLRCLHGQLPQGYRCSVEVLASDPEFLASGYAGPFREVRDGVIVSRWSGIRPNYEPDYESEFSWRYEDDDLSHRPVATQRHTVRFVIGPENIDPVFECLHAEGDRCDAATWREDLWAFPEWHAGPESAVHAGNIVSWWTGGQPNDTDFPWWTYEAHAAAAITDNLAAAALAGAEKS